MLVGSYGSAIESPQRRVESGHRLHEIVQERSFVPSGAKPALKSQHLISYSKQGGVQHHLGSQVHWSSCHYYSPALFCFPNKTKIVVDVGRLAFILRRKWGSLYLPAVSVRSILFIVEQNEEKLSASCRVVRVK